MEKLAAGVGVPAGAIIMWSGTTSNIPTGWALCDGQNGTPDLRDRFIVGAGPGYAVGATGGEATHKLTETEMPSHGHDIEKDSAGTYAQSWNVPITGTDWYFGGTHMRTLSAGGDMPHENRPPYFALCFVMKVGS